MTDRSDATSSEWDGLTGSYQGLWGSQQDQSATDSTSVSRGAGPGFSIRDPSHRDLPPRTPRWTPTRELSLRSAAERANAQ